MLTPALDLLSENFFSVNIFYYKNQFIIQILGCDFDSKSINLNFLMLRTYKESIANRYKVQFYKKS